MKINYDNINIPDENLNKVVSESLETVKKLHTRSCLRRCCPSDRHQYF